MPAQDSPQDYLNLRVPHRHAGKQDFQHRLGAFQARGRGVRGKGHPPAPSLGVLHVPHADIITRTGRDLTAERIARYLADPPERRNASIHAFSDRDSYVICQPFDSEAWGAGNSHANAAAIQFEIGGRLGQGDAYWRGDDAVKKYIQTAKAVIKGSVLAFGDEWEWAIPPLEKAELNKDGSVRRPGWTQHREVPYFNRRTRKYNQVNPRTNQVKGQNPDVTPNFPWGIWFEILAKEMIRYRQSGAA